MVIRMQSQNGINMMADIINKGSVGVIPTDTVYGVCAKASNVDAVTRMYKLKKRENKPGTLIAESIDQLVSLGIRKRYLTAVKDYWPGAISVILPVDDSLNYLHQGKQSLAVRIPNNNNLISLLIKTGPLITSSANLPGKKPAVNIKEAKKYFNDNVDFYLDGGDINNKPSTVIRIIDDAVVILREGSVKINEHTGRIIG